MTLVLTLSALSFLNNNLRLTDDPLKCFLSISKTENKKVETSIVRVCAAIRFHVLYNNSKKTHQKAIAERYKDVNFSVSIT